MALPALPHLRSLEAEAIHILRETAAQFRAPVLLYSIGKDSSVLVHLARKAFYPGKLPFPLLHIDTTYEYPELIEFRDRSRARSAPTCGCTPIARRSRPERIRTRWARPTAATCSGRARWSRDSRRAATTPRSAGGGATRSAPAPRSASSASAIRKDAGSRATSGPSSGTFTTAASTAARASASSRCRIGRRPTSGATSTRSTSRWYRSTSPSPAEVLLRGDTLIPLETNVKLLPGEEPVTVICRMRSLGCTPCSGAIRSDADTRPKSSRS